MFGGGGGGGSRDGSVASPNGAAGGFGAGGGGGAYSTGNGGAGGFGGGGGGAVLFAGGPGGYLGGNGGGGSNSQTGGGGGGAGMGGAVFNEAGTVVITNSTFTGNVAAGGGGGSGRFGAKNGTDGSARGGGLFNHNGAITVTNSTFSANTAAQGGRSILNFGDSQFNTTASTTATATITYSILGQAVASGPELTQSRLLFGSATSGSATVSGGSNLIRVVNVSSGTNNLTGTLTTDPRLGPLQNNGGPTPTMALLTGSPAILAGIRTSPLVAGAAFAGAAAAGLRSDTYYYRVSAFNSLGETLASAEVSAFLPNMTDSPFFTGVMAIFWKPASGPVSGYKVYGRTAGSERLIATLSPGTTSFVDDGSIDPSAALPALNTTTVTTDQRGNPRAVDLPVDLGAFDLSKSLTTYSVKNDADRQSLILSINALSPQSPPLVQQINLAAGTYSDIALRPPAGVYVILHGTGTDTIVVGHSPALTVTGGNVWVEDMMLETDTDSPTVLVTDGDLAMRNDEIEETPDFNDPDVDVTGGFVDLGSDDDPGSNRFDGQGNFLWAADPAEINSFGDNFPTNGITATDSAPTLTFVTTATPEVRFGQGVQLTATVISENGGTPTGDVDFFDVSSNTDLGTAPVTLVQGVAQATLTTSPLAVGPHDIRATYAGDIGFLSSEAVVTTQVAALLGGGQGNDQIYVNALYRQLVGRDAEALGSAYWVGLLTQGFTRQQVSAGILNSDEARLLQINNFYQTYLGRSGEAGGVAADLQFLQQGGSLESLRTTFLTSAEYMARSGGSPEQYVDALYFNLLHRSSTGDDGANSFVKLIQDGGDNATVVRSILTSQEGSQTLASQLYGTILERTPDTDGLSFWTTKLQETGGAEEQAMVSFLASEEFFSRD